MHVKSSAVPSTHPVDPDPSLPRWQQGSAAGLHVLLYALVFATTLSGWYFASFRGWSIRLYGLLPLPMLTDGNSPLARSIGGWHWAAEWALLIAIGLHVAAALGHAFVLKDGVLRRMLPGRA